MKSSDAIGDGQRLPVSLLTGFLGSGKTTVLNHLLRQPALAKTAVVINEFGAIGLDHELVESSNEEMVLLQSVSAAPSAGTSWIRCASSPCVVITARSRRSTAS